MSDSRFRPTDIDREMARHDRQALVFAFLIMVGAVLMLGVFLAVIELLRHSIGVFALMPAGLITGSNFVIWVWCALKIADRW